MSISVLQKDVKSLVEDLNFAEKVERALGLIREAYEEFGDRLVVANSLGKDSMVVWHLAKRVSPDIRGFIVTTRFKPQETKDFMRKLVAEHPELHVYENPAPIPERLYETDPDRCCELLKVEPDAWLDEIPAIREYYDRFGDHLPKGLYTQLDALEQRLKDA